MVGDGGRGVKRKMGDGDGARFALLCAALSVGLCVYYAWAGICLGNAGEGVSNRMRIHAIPVALSYLYQGRPHDLTAWKGVEGAFRDKTRPLNGLIERFLAPRDGIDKSGVYYWNADDRGMGDYAALAFTMFGPRASSLYWLYICVFAASVGTFMLVLWRDALAMWALVLLLGGHIVLLYLTPLNGAWFQYHEPAHPIHDSRVFDALAIFAFASVLLVGLGRVALTKTVCIGLSIQVVLLAFLLLARSSIKLGLVAVVLALAVALCADLTRTRGARGAAKSGWRNAAVGICAVIAVFLVSSAYRGQVYNDRYSAADRTVWHNVLMGVGVPEAGRPFPRNEVNDYWVAKTVLRHFNGHKPAHTPPWTTRTILNSLGDVTRFDWSPYEREARSIYFELWRTYPGKLAKWYLFDKPLGLLGKLGQAASMVKRIDAAWGGDSCAEGAAARFTLLHWPVVIALIVVGFLGRKEFPAQAGRSIAALGVGALVFLVPSILFYGFLTNLSGFVVLAASACYGLLAWLVAYGSNRWLERGRSPSRTA